MKHETTFTIYLKMQFQGQFPDKLFCCYWICMRLYWSYFLWEIQFAKILDHGSTDWVHWTSRTIALCYNMLYSSKYLDCSRKLFSIFIGNTKQHTAFTTHVKMRFQWESSSELFCCYYCRVSLYWSKVLWKSKFAKNL